MLELKDIKKSYKVGDNKQEVLKGIDINFRRSEFVSILGASGSGKTTLLNIIGGLDKYDSGDLIIEDISTKKYYDRDWDTYRNYRVGFIFQSYNLIMHQSVLANVEMALTLSGVSRHKRRKKAKEALIEVGLKEHIHKKPNQLSGGQMQRVAIARAIVNDPEIILADEPTGALDSTTSVQIMDLLKKISKDKLVIMVTHNPDIAKQYSTRIIELKDGKVIKDSKAFDGKEKKVEEKITKKTSMSLFTSLSLSFRNLLTKKGRTLLTAFAGSIGIIGIALILSLSNGVRKYASNLEKESLADYPIAIERTSYDLLGSFAAMFSDEANNEKCDENKLCSQDDIVKASRIDTSKGIAKHNNVKEFKKFIDSNDEIKKYADSIVSVYDINLQVYTKDYNKVNPSPIISKEENNIFTELSIKQNKFEVLAGKMPEKANELVLVVGNNNLVNDSILYSLGIKNANTLIEDLAKIRDDEKYRVKPTELDYNDILNKTYKLILNTDKYKENDGLYIDYSNDYDYMKSKIDNGLDIKIVGIAKDKDNSSSYVGYTTELTKYLIENISKTKMYEKQINNKNINVLTGKEFDGVISSYDELVKELGIYELDNPSTLNIYPKDYDAKQKIVNIIDKYNEEKRKENREDLVINYADIMKNLVNGITSVVNIISMVLIGFVAISSLMGLVKIFFIQSSFHALFIITVS